MPNNFIPKLGHRFSSGPSPHLGLTVSSTAKCLKLNRRAGIHALTPQSFDKLMNVNARGAVFTFVHALPLLADGASVIFTGSVASRKGQPGDPVYAGSKGFIRVFVRSAGTDPELMKRRLRINVVTPGPTETPMKEQATSDDVTRQWVSQLIPMRRPAMVRCERCERSRNRLTEFR